jgi:myo-inositol-1(or 4)-monophosphatase
MAKRTVMKSPKLNLMRDVAIEAALRAGKVLRKYYREGRFHVAEKPGAGLVTNADLEAEAQAVKTLKKAFPQFGFLTEEAQPLAASCPGRWIIDPLDGTTNFVHGFPMFCVSIAAEWEGEGVVGVIYHPILNDLYVAVKGKGAFLNGERIHVSSTEQVSEALLTTGFTYKKEQALKQEMTAFERLSSSSRAVRRPGSAALDLAFTACGVFDGFWEQHLSPWDVAAGALLVLEAGGKVTNFSGKSFDIHSKEILASNGLLHAALQGELKRS